MRKALGVCLVTSSIGTGDQFTFAGPGPLPVVTRLRPSSGSPRGGTRVLIFGHYLGGATAVFFGSRRATHLRMISATEIQVTSPRGRGAVHVTVQTPDGTSRAVRQTIFRY